MLKRVVLRALGKCFDERSGLQGSRREGGPGAAVLVGTYRLTPAACCCCTPLLEIRQTRPHCVPLGSLSPAADWTVTRTAKEVEDGSLNTYRQRPACQQAQMNRV